MVKIVEGQLIGKGKRFGIVVSRFNDFITEKLLGGGLGRSFEDRCKRE